MWVFLQSLEHEIESVGTIMSIRGCNVLKNIKLNGYLQSFQKLRKYCVCKIDEFLKMCLPLKKWRKPLSFLIEPDLPKVINSPLEQYQVALVSFLLSV